MTDHPSAREYLTGREAVVSRLATFMVDTLLESVPALEDISRRDRSLAKAVFRYGGVRAFRQDFGEKGSLEDMWTRGITSRSDRPYITALQKHLPSNMPIQYADPDATYRRRAELE